jgi:hypothetical protein
MSFDPPKPKPPDFTRIATASAVSAVCGALPIPWLPEMLSKRSRVRLVRGLAERHAIELPQDVAEVLIAGVEVGIGERLVRAVARTAMLRLFARIGPLALFFAARDGVGTLLLGVLFDHYLARVRARGGRIDRREAERVRLAVDRTLTRPWRTLRGESLDGLGALERLQHAFEREFARTA